ncbi:hypothetical protein SBV1_2080006 [Verrucomicrobia bacterium]|nr:hypothetical protein SBV1_2080006 [Verrucomicrobiota bacterium]
MSSTCEFGFRPSNVACAQLHGSGPHPSSKLSASFPAHRNSLKIPATQPLLSTPQTLLSHF